MSNTATELIEDYADWLKRSTTAEDAIDGWGTITTPFLDRHNDHLQIHVRREGTRLEMTDDGYTLAELEMSGCPVDSPRRRALLSETLRGLGVDKRGEALCVTAEPGQAPAKKHDLLTAMVRVGDLFMLSKASVQSFFTEDVQHWLDENDVSYSAGVSFRGRTGYSQRFDFLISARKSRGIPERVVQTINRPERAQASLAIQAWNDVRETRPGDAEAYVLINDTKPLPAGFTEALDAYKMKPVVWSNRNDIVRYLAA